MAASRAANIWPCAAAVNYLRLPSQRIPQSHQFMLWLVFFCKGRRLLCTDAPCDGSKGTGLWPFADKARWPCRWSGLRGAMAFAIAMEAAEALPGKANAAAAAAAAAAAN